MLITLRRGFTISIFFFILLLFSFSLVFSNAATGNLFRGLTKPVPSFRWRDIPQQYPVDEFKALPSGRSPTIPQIQFDFAPESTAEKSERERRLAAVKRAFVHAWRGYKEHAWLHDEVAPISGRARNGFGGWGATLVDSLDTLWIMGLKRDFHEAVSALDYIDFSAGPDYPISVFETNIRYLGGLLSAFDLSGQSYPNILAKAIEVGDMLYKAFDTPERMPIMHWSWEQAIRGTTGQETPFNALLAEYGSLSLEFTRLSQITGNLKYYDAVARVMDVFASEQNKTTIPGLWPITLKAKLKNFADDTLFSMGAMADSAYEYLPKQYLLLNGQDESFKTMYLSALAAAEETLFFKPLAPNKTDMLFSGTTRRHGQEDLQQSPETQHLTCFVGGMVALGAKIFSRPEDLKTARRLTDGCIWAYASMPTGIMPEMFTIHKCAEDSNPSCTWSEESWYEEIASATVGATKTESIEDHAQQVIQRRHLTPGITSFTDTRYMLRPEALESVFVLYRLTGNRTLMDDGWKMFEAIEKLTRTRIAHAGIQDVSVENPSLEDKMESFWTGETLKYAYLLFSDPTVVNLDHWVLNTEAHPLSRIHDDVDG